MLISWLLENDYTHQRRPLYPSFISTLCQPIETDIKNWLWGCNGLSLWVVICSKHLIYWLIWGHCSRSCCFLFYFLLSIRWRCPLPSISMHCSRQPIPFVLYKNIFFIESDTPSRDSPKTRVSWNPNTQPNLSSLLSFMHFTEKQIW